MIRARVAALLVAAAVLGSACDEPAGRRAGRTAAGRDSARPGGAGETPAGPDGGAHERRRTAPRGIPVRNLGLSPLDRQRVARAVNDLKDLGFWKRLTRHVESVIIATRPGSEHVPLDGHLADAVMNVRLGRHAGYVCDIVIFSHALEDDVARQETYYEQGRLAHPAPTLRQFWAVILAHELAHCSERGQRGERYSTIWERRVLRAFGVDRLGSG